MRSTMFVFFLATGCGQATSTSKPNPVNSDEPTASLADESCPGFALAGLKYSPGGSVLPHTCKPFDAVTNNPYAVRCVDAMAAYKTKYPGDEFCILPPPPDKGLQVGAHPQGASYWGKMWAGDFSDYANAKLTKPYEMAPGTEVVQNYYTMADNAQAHRYFRIDTRMRPGSHHLLSWLPAKTPIPEGWASLSDQSLLSGAPFYNVQSTHSDRPSVIEIAPENKGLGMPFPAKTPVTFQLHHINAANAPMLREAWINVWWLPDSETVKPVQVQALNVTVIDYPPNQLIDSVHTAKATGDTRIVSAFGHRHAWTTRLNASINRADGTTEDLYESFSWLEMPTYQYDSATRNPTPNVARGVDGALSGLTTLHAGDEVSYACHVDTTPAGAEKLGVPVPKNNLTFGNQAYGAEMCDLYLETTGAPLSYGDGLTQVPPM